MFEKLDANSFSEAQEFKTNQLEAILQECIKIYNNITITQSNFPNKENIIRNEFLTYLKNDDYKNAHNPLGNYHFDKETDEDAGRADIRILPVNPYQGDRAYYIIECKRLDSKNLKGSTGLNAKYIANGICRFIYEIYPSYYKVSVMFGFLVESLNIDTDIVDNINSMIDHPFVNDHDKIVNANAIRKLQHHNLSGGYKYAYTSRHKINTRNTSIILYHLMFDFSRNILST